MTPRTTARTVTPAEGARFNAGPIRHTPFPIRRRASPRTRACGTCACASVTRSGDCGLNRPANQAQIPAMSVGCAQTGLNPSARTPFSLRSHEPAAGAAGGFFIVQVCPMITQSLLPSAGLYQTISSTDVILSPTTSSFSDTCLPGNFSLYPPCSGN